MDDLKLFDKTERRVEFLVNTVRVFSCDIGMVFVIKRGKVQNSEGIFLPDGREINLQLSVCAGNR